jgi:hypothetical protein
MNRNPKKTIEMKTTMNEHEQRIVCNENDHTNWSTFLTIESPAYCAKNLKHSLYNKHCDGTKCSKKFTDEKITEENKNEAFRPTTKKPIFECKNKCGFSICFYCRESVRISEIAEMEKKRSVV